ncbi:hypothetical protein CR513_30703, partial [Mucuna pruriens]
MYISGGDDKLSCKLFPGTLRGVAMQWMTTLPARTIRTFNDLASAFASQFAANKAKQLEVADLFDIRQAKEESLKSDLARFNNATVRVNDPDQKFFIKTFQKGLRASPFSDSLALKRPNSMDEIRARAEKHIEVEEDQAERMAEERVQTKRNEGRIIAQNADVSKRSEAAHKDKHFTPLNEKRAQILREICHTRLLRFPPASDGKILGNNQTECQYSTRKEERQDRRRSRSRQNSPIPHKGVISTIAGGAHKHPLKIDQPRKEVQEQTLSHSENEHRDRPLLSRTKTVGEKRRGCDEPMVISIVAKQYKIERVLIDQESSANILYWTTAQKLGVRNLTRCEGVLYGFAGERVPIRGTVEIETTFGDRNGTRTIPVVYTVVDIEASYNIIMGRPALNKLEAVVSTHHLCMKFPTGRAITTVWADITTARRCYEDSLRIELASKEAEVNVLDIDLDPRYFSEEKRPHPVGDLKEVQIGMSADQKTNIGTMLGEKEESQLISTLRRNADIFAWTARDMPRIDPGFMCHHLSVSPGSKPVAQRKRKQGEEKRAAIKDEVRKLLAAGFVKEVQYPTWLANVVMVKKANGRWRMCTDYTDLNKACPKDPYPLPSIDRLVDGVSGHALLSLMDAYSGYNQIRMNPANEEKNAFITEEGAFCYKVMPFGLKNAGATYQCLMDKVFQEIIGVDMEVYVDDMVVKSSKEEAHYHTLERVFTILRKNQLRLNPEKCSFGVRAGKFLGFMLTERGIEANPDKCQAIIDMRSPQNVKEVY